MSLSTTFNKDTLERLGNLERQDFVAFASAVTLGYNPTTFFEAVQGFKNGVDPQLPQSTGQPKPLTVNAWSFVNDRAQYNGVYGLSTADAAAIKELLMRNRDEAVKQIEDLVSDHLHRRGSNKSANVSLEGMPGDRSGPGASESSSVARELKVEINSAGSRYGRYHFEAVQSPLGGPHAYTVPLGGGFSAYFANKRGAIDVARIARVRGRHFPLIDGYVGFLHPEAKDPVFGSSIPSKAAWDCTMGPDDTPPAPPTGKAPTRT